MVKGVGRCCVGLLPACIATVALWLSSFTNFWCESIEFPPQLSLEELQGLTTNSGGDAMEDIMTNINTTEGDTTNNNSTNVTLTSDDSNNTTNSTNMTTITATTTSPPTSSVFENFTNVDGEIASLQFGLFNYHKVKLSSSTVRVNNINDATSDLTSFDYVGETGSCTRYDSTIERDFMWNLARYMAIISVSLGGLVTFGLWTTQCFYYLNGVAYAAFTVAALLVLPIVQGLTLLVIQSDLCNDNPIVQDAALITSIEDETDLYDSNSCEAFIGIGGTAGSSALWLLAGVTMILLGRPIRPDHLNPQPEKNLEYFPSSHMTTNADGEDPNDPAMVVIE